MKSLAAAVADGELLQLAWQRLEVVHLGHVHAVLLLREGLVAVEVARVYWKSGGVGVLEMEKEAGLMRKELPGMSSHERLGYLCVSVPIRPTGNDEIGRVLEATGARLELVERGHVCV